MKRFEVGKCIQASRVTCFQEKAALLAELEALRNEGKRTEELQKLMASLEQDAEEEAPEGGGKVSAKSRRAAPGRQVCTHASASPHLTVGTRVVARGGRSAEGRDRAAAEPGQGGRAARGRASRFAGEG